MMNKVLDEHFVPWFRAVAPYIHAYHGQTFVVGIVGELIAAGRLTAFVQDLAILHAMGIKIVLVHGFRPQVDEQLAAKGHPAVFNQGRRVTDAVALDCAQEAAGQLRFEIEAAFSQGLPNTPMANSTVRIISGNFVTARPYGIIDGVNFLHSGAVRKVDSASIRAIIDGGAMVLLSPFGFSPTGEAFNLVMEELATQVAIGLKADKLLFMTEVDGIHESPLDESSPIDTEMTVAESERLLASLPRPERPTDLSFYLQYCVQACRAGVERSHILPFAFDGALLKEVFTHDGIGTMIVDEKLESLREASSDDVGGILKIIEPLEQRGALVKRDRADIERDIALYTVIEHDGIIFGCAALYPYPEAGTGEMAALTVADHVQGQGDGERILRRIEQRARAQGLASIFVLTTQTTHWFLKRVFQLVDPDWLPEARKRKYNRERRSQVLVKRLGDSSAKAR